MSKHHSPNDQRAIAMNRNNAEFYNSRGIPVPSNLGNAAAKDGSDAKESPKKEEGTPPTKSNE